jgi:hypothetical protein
VPPVPELKAVTKVFEAIFVPVKTMPIEIKPVRAVTVRIVPDTVPVIDVVPPIVQDILEVD